MFRNTYQSGLLSILYSCGSSPLAIWDKQAKNGYIKRITDDEVKSLVLEIAGTNVATTFIYCPSDRKRVLGIRLPFLIMIIKNMKKYFTFEITILDDKDMHRRFRISNFQSTTRVRPFCTTMPIGLSGGWNQIQFNLADFTRRAYGTNYVETSRMQIHANCRIRRIYFADRLYSEDKTPEEFKLFFQVRRKKCVREEQKERKVASPDVAQFIKDPLPEEPPAFYAEDVKRASEVAVPSVELEEIVEKQKPPVEIPPQEENLQVPTESVETADVSEEEATIDEAAPVEEPIAPTESMIEEEESETDAPETELSSEEEEG